MVPKGNPKMAAKVIDIRLWVLPKSTNNTSNCSFSVNDDVILGDLFLIEL
jgi:hypothetical protein